MALSEIFSDFTRVAEEFPDGAGEFLRAWAFPGEDYGCYSTFDLLPDFKEAAVTPREFEFLWGRSFEPQDTDPNDWGYCDAEAIKAIRWFIHPNGVEVGWHWDGDGTLAFYAPEFGQRVLRNNDCKKANEWEFAALYTDKRGGE